MNPKARHQDVLVHVVDQEAVVYDKTKKKAHRLNETVASVWPLLDGSRSVRDIAAELDIDASVVELAVDSLGQAELLEAGDALSVSRRRMLGRVAAAAAAGMMLPAITSIAAPLAAQAQSCGVVKKKKKSTVEKIVEKVTKKSTKDPTKKATKKTRGSC